MRTYLGTQFEIWTGQQSWFWRFSDPNRDSGSIGAAATEADAIREACSAIEEMSKVTMIPWRVWRNRSLADLERSAELLSIRWERSLNCLAEYLSQIPNAGA